MRFHRAVTLVVMMLLAVGLFIVMTAGAISTFDAHSLIALGVVVLAAAVGGVAFSWRRYYRRVPRTDR
jgi:membrane protein implicated in regulation of membrane protease activity